jgi:cyclohexyl-isocyanide hydratase
MNVGILLFPDITALDAVGPFEVLARLPGAKVYFAGPERGPVTAQNGLTLGVDTPYAECPALDVLLVPGGSGVSALMEDPATVSFLRSQAAGAQWVTSVCTGSLVLGAAGLLQGYRATTHWRYVDCLEELGAVPVRKRVVVDRNRVTAAGVSAGIDLGLYLSALIAGESAAREIQLHLEYDPQPSFNSGSPETADPELVAAAEKRTQEQYDRRLAQCRRIGTALPNA